MGIGGRMRKREREGNIGRSTNPSIVPPSRVPAAPPHERFQYPVMSVAQCTHYKVRRPILPRVCLAPRRWITNQIESPNNSRIL